MVPTLAECIAKLGETYDAKGVAIVLCGRVGALGGGRPEELMQTAEGRQRVYDWAYSLAEGAF